MKNKAGAIIAFVCIIMFIIGAIGSCSDDDKRDAAYDKDGFMGYSDGFWEWYQDNNK